jgi:hypothetical protein
VLDQQGVGFDLGKEADAGLGEFPAAQAAEKPITLLMMSRTDATVCLRF